MTASPLTLAPKMDVNFSESELKLKRFARHFLLPGFNQEHQARLHKSRIVIVGMGGLGNSVAQCLAAAGVGGMSIIDFDIVEESNLARQFLFNERDLGNAKAIVACRKLSTAFPGVKFLPRHEKLDRENREKLLAHHDLILDCCDQAVSKYDIDEAAASLRIPVVFGAVNQFEGQLAVFHGKRNSTYSQTFSRATGSQPADDCNSMGVWSPAVGIVGNMMAQEALNMLAFGNSKLDGFLLNMHLSDYESHLFKLGDFDDSQDSASEKGSNSTRSISANEVAQLQALHETTRLIFIMNEEDNNATNDGGTNMSLDELMWSCADWDKETPIVLTCKSGMKSMQAALLLAGDGFARVYYVRAQ